MYLFGRTQPLSRYSIWEALETIKRLGFDGAEVCFENEDIGFDKLDGQLAARIREKLSELSLKPYSVSYHQDYVYNDENFTGLTKAISLTGKLGTDIFVISCPYARMKDQEEWDKTVSRVRELSKTAEQYGVTLALEPEPNFVIGSTEALLRLFDEVSSPNLGANLDLGHMFLRDTDPIGMIHTVGKRAVHAHVENMKAGVHDHRLLDDGDMDLKVYLKALKDIGFKGGMALDIYKFDYEEIAPGSIEILRNIMKEI